MKTKNLLVLTSILTLLMSSCNESLNNDFSIVSPVGAPTLAIYETLAKNENAITESDATKIPGYLKEGTRFDYIVFDSINALKLTNNLKQAKYTYLTLLTGGNFHLAGFNKNTLPSVGDKIVCFGKNLIPDLAIKLCFNDLFNDSNLENITYVNAVTDVVPILKSGKYEGNDIDYCFIAQPALYNVMNSNNNDNNNNNDVYDILNINDKIKEITNNRFSYIPQAGLFVRDDYLLNNPTKVDQFLNNVKTQISLASSGDNKVVEVINEYSNDLSIQASYYGYNVNTYKKLQENNSNQFGLINENITINDINEFLNTIEAGFTINEK